MTFNESLAKFMSQVIKKGQKIGKFNKEIEPKVFSELRLRKIEGLWGRMNKSTIDELFEE